MSTKKNALKIQNSLYNYWYNDFQLYDYQVVGFTACFMQESSCDPKAKNGNAKGIALWIGSAKTRVKSLMKKSDDPDKWTLDEQIRAVELCCSDKFLRLLKTANSYERAVDIVLRGFENGSGGASDVLCTVEQFIKVYDTQTHQFRHPDRYDNVYEEFMDPRVQNAKKILGWMNSEAKNQYTHIYTNDGQSIDPDNDIDTMDESKYNVNSIYEKLLQDIQNNPDAYPDMPELPTFTGSGGNIFNSPADNTITFTYTSNNKFKNMIETGNNQLHTRIYSTNSATIILDEMSADISEDLKQSSSEK